MNLLIPVLAAITGVAVLIESGPGSLLMFFAMIALLVIMVKAADSL